MTTQEYLAGVHKVHGERYDYSRLVYRNKRSKVEIVCREHGPFWQNAAAHKLGQNCPKCAYRESISTTEEFIKKAKKIHGDRYDYSKGAYTGWNNKVTICCQTHGDFNQTPNNHLHGFGCQTCGYVGIPPRSKCKSTEKFIVQARRLHGDRYEYDRLGYTYSLKSVTITCKVHGDFKQLASNHLRGSGCPKCSNRYYSWGEDMIRKCLDMWGWQYKPQKCFSGLINPKSGRHLRYDFCIEDRKLLIEFDGAQHYKILAGKKPEDLERIRSLDKLKDQWAVDNGYQIVRVPFFANDVETFLKGKINAKT